MFKIIQITVLFKRILYNLRVYQLICYVIADAVQILFKHFFQQKQTLNYDSLSLFFTLQSYKNHIHN